MKRSVILTVVVFFLLFVVAFAQAEILEIEFSYDPADPSQAATGYKVYADGTEVCTATNVQAGPPAVFECDANALDPGAYDFTMAAQYGANNTLTPQSAPYNFTIPIPDPVAPNVLRIRIRD